MTIKKTLSWILPLLLFATPSFAQQPKPSPEATRATIFDVKKGPDGNLVFAVRIHAPGSKMLDLSHPAPQRNPNVEKTVGDDDPLPFSMAGSTLRDTYTDKVYTCLSTLPRNPFFGPMDVSTVIPAGGWIQLGVAFPPIPPPPEKDGKKQPYLFLLEIPELKVRTPLKLDPDTLKPM